MSTTPEVPSTPTAYQNVVFRDGRPVLNNEQVGVSPTGTPKVSPTAVPWLIGAMVGAVAGLELCATAAPSPAAQLGCRIGAVVLAGALGVVSPGWRK